MNFFNLHNHFFYGNRVHILLVVLLTCVASNLHAEAHWIWEGHFSTRERKDLMNWIKHADSGITTLFGSLPYQYKVFFYHSNDGNGPCPWAHTRKYTDRESHFYVNTSYTLEKVKQDWTASHELSHLIFPYLGRKGMWFAEGIASYLQYQIMYANNTINWTQAVDKLHERFDKARSYKNFDQSSILELSSYGKDILNKKIFNMDSNYYIRLYWGGAAYFLHVDKNLYEKKKIRLCQ